jgi:mono/diheme cytochrome c family protein
MKYLTALVAILIISCGSNDQQDHSDNHGRTIYIQQCVLCHGESGADGVSGAKDLTRSVLTQKEVREIVANGRRAMRAYSEILTPEEINMVSAFVLDLRME